jgi:hypothetical protein
MFRLFDLFMLYIVNVTRHVYSLGVTLNLYFQENTEITT